MFINGVWTLIKFWIINLYVSLGFHVKFKFRFLGFHVKFKFRFSYIINLYILAMNLKFGYDKCYSAGQPNNQNQRNRYTITSNFPSYHPFQYQWFKDSNLAVLLKWFFSAICKKITYLRLIVGNVGRKISI
jgi:hypothetical protein